MYFIISIHPTCIYICFQGRNHYHSQYCKSWRFHRLGRHILFRVIRLSHDIKLGIAKPPFVCGIRKSKPSQNGNCMRKQGDSSRCKPRTCRSRALLSDTNSRHCYCSRMYKLQAGRLRNRLPLPHDRSEICQINIHMRQSVVCCESAKQNRRNACQRTKERRKRHAGLFRLYHVYMG